MKKVLFISLDVIYDLKGTPMFDDFIDCLNKIVDTHNNELAFISRNISRLKRAENEFGDLNDKFNFITRSNAKDVIKKHGKNYFIILGNRDQDFFNAINYKTLFLCPSWTIEVEPKAKKYGIKISNPLELLEIVKTSNNQNYWYSYHELDDGNVVLSLMDGAYRYYAKSPQEREMIANFEKVLKDVGIKSSYFDILQYHFLAAISNDNELFKDVDIWGVFPSSTTHLNPEMLYFKERVRYMMGGREPKCEEGENNILLRHVNVTKSQFTSGHIRYSEGADKHLNSIHVNPAFKDKVKESTICIFDDFLNYGNSFEAARNLLKTAGAKKIIFVALGKFRKPYLYQNYEIIGDVFSPNFEFTRLDRMEIDHYDFDINDEAKNEVENLHRIFNL